jgi:hypothetical protein
MKGEVIMKNTYYWTCPTCGANLDPGEKCDVCNPVSKIPYPDAKDYKSVDLYYNRKEVIDNVAKKSS